MTCQNMWCLLQHCYSRLRFFCYTETLFPGRCATSHLRSGRATRRGEFNPDTGILAALARASTSGFAKRLSTCSNEVVSFRFLLVFAGTRTSLWVQARFAIFVCWLVSEMRNHSALRSHRSVSNVASGLETPKLRSVFDVAHRTGHFDRFLRDTCIILYYSALLWPYSSCANLFVSVGFQHLDHSRKGSTLLWKMSNQCLAREQSEKAVCEH